MKSICFLIRKLDEGGAQRQLVELVKSLEALRYNITVMSYSDGGGFSHEVKQLPGVRYISLDKKRRWDVIGFLYRLIREMRRLKPDVLHSYLGTSNILAVLLKPFLRKSKIVWGIRASNMDLKNYDWLASVIFHTECFVSRFADLIIFNSNAGRDYHLQLGFPEKKLIVIPNGIDTERFKPNLKSRENIRSEWGIQPNEILIGLVGRLDPMKDHPTFLKAASLLAAERSDVRFACIGDGPLDYKSKLHSLSHQLGLERKLIWTGNRSDVAAIFNALDIASLSSYGEGFPNVIGEAMSCGVPCVVTDVGDAA